MRKYGGLIAGVALLLLTVVLAWLFRQSLMPPELTEVTHGAIRSDAELYFATWAVIVLMGIAPALVALAMLWIAFVRVDVRDRYLWSAVTVISSPNVAEVLQYLVPGPKGQWPTLAGRYYISEPIASGMIAYAAWFLALTKDSRRPSLAIIPLVAFLALLVLPIPASFVSWATMICTVCAACGIWAIAAWIAARVGFDVYEPESSELTDAV